MIYKLGGGKTKVGRKSFDDMVEMQKELYTPLIALVVDHEGSKKMEWQDERPTHNYKNLRQLEVQIFSPNAINSPNNYFAVYDMRSLTRFQAGLGII